MGARSHKNFRDAALGDQEDLSHVVGAGEAVDAGLGTIVARRGGVDGTLTEVLRRLPEPPA